jgi:flagellar P-ring protein FlgI
MKRFHEIRYLFFSITLLVTAMASPSFGQENRVRIGDLTDLQGLRTNQLLGVGILTGLDGRGDGSRSVPIRNSLSTVMGHFGIDVEPEDAGGKNSAMVLVTAELPPFARSGDRIDVTVSSMLDAKNVKGGVLLQTPLKSAGGDIFAVAQGRVEHSGEYSTVGSIPSGAIMEDTVTASLSGEGSFTLVLRRPDFGTAWQIAEAVREAFPDLTVEARDASTVAIGFEQNDVVRLIGEIEGLSISVQPAARVVIDEASGIVVMGGDVKIAPVTVTYRGTTIEIGPVGRRNGGTSGFTLQETVSVSSFFEVLQDAGVKTDDIIDIVKVIYRAGALYGTLELL